MPDAEFQVFAVFFSQGGNRQRSVGKIDTLMLGERASIYYCAFHVLAGSSIHARYRFDDPLSKCAVTYGNQEEVGARHVLCSEK